MKIDAVFAKFITRDEKTGESEFSAVPYGGDGRETFRGIIPPYRAGTPITILSDEDHAEARTALCSTHRDMMEAFLRKDPAFSMGVCAKAFAAGTGDIFRKLREDISYAPGRMKGIRPEMAEKAVKALRSMVSLENTLGEVLRIGGSYRNAEEAFLKFGDDAPGAVRRNPYILLNSDAPLSICERAAKGIGMEASDIRRTSAVVWHAMKKNEGSGSTRISFESLCRKIRRMEDAAGGIYSTSPIYIGEALSDRRYVIERRDEDGGIWAYMKEDYEDEEAVASGLRRLCTSSGPTGIMTDADAVERLCGTRYSNGQRAALGSLATSGVKIITGGPGTGKTTLLKGMVAAYSTARGGDGIALMAPTGCAARRMSEATGLPAQTIHKMLRIRPEEHGSMDAEELDAGLVVVDECSMVDTELMARLVSSIHNGTIVILMGDPDQLPSVGAGNVLKDIAESEAVPVYRLTETFRQDKRSLIIGNAAKVMRGDMSLMEGDTFRIIRARDGREAALAAVRIEKDSIRRGTDTKLYTPARNPKFMSGSVRLNSMVQEGRAKGGAPSVLYGQYAFYEGDRVIFNRNDYDTGYYNGEDGVITSIQKHTGTTHVTVRTYDGDIQLKSGALQDIEPAYALTAHKSQGGECEEAVVLVPNEPAGMLKRQLLYVEITRARKRVTMICEDGALRKALGLRGIMTRETGLRGKIMAGMRAGQEGEGISP